MSNKLQMMLLFVEFIVLLYFIASIKRRVVSVKHSLMWLLGVLLLFVFTLFPDILNVLCGFMGIETSSNMLFFFGFIILLIIAYTHTISLSKATEKRKDLVQHIALIEYEYERISH